MSIYDFEVKDGDGNMVSMSQYKDKVLLIVNSATKCGFTPQYTELNEIYAEFHDDGFEILDFPCNQFGKQAPGSTEEITEVCRSKWLVPYQIFDKIDVNGENASPLFEYLKSEQPFTDITGKGATKLKLVLKEPDRTSISRYCSRSMSWNRMKRQSVPQKSTSVCVNSTLKFLMLQSV